MKKILIIGNGSDVLDRKRGKFITSTFDEIVICNQALFHIDAFADYIGTPTIWGNCGWVNDHDVFNPSQEFILRISKLLSENKIKEVWLNCVEQTKIEYKIPEGINVKYIYDNKIEKCPYHSLGLQCMLNALDEGYKVYYCGVDSYLKSYHFYEESEKTSQAREKNNYIKERVLIRELINLNKITHIDDYEDN